MKGSLPRKGRFASIFLAEWSREIFALDFVLDANTFRAEVLLAVINLLMGEGGR
jgi:hypothetical protein